MNGANSLVGSIDTTTSALESSALSTTKVALVDALDLDRHHSGTDSKAFGSLSHLRDDADRPFGHVRDISLAVPNCRFVVACTEEQDELSHLSGENTNNTLSTSSLLSSLDPNVGIATRIKSYHHEGGEGEYLFVNLKGSSHGVKGPQEIFPTLPKTQTYSPKMTNKTIRKEPGIRMQRGVLRTNCVDCLDRTNVGQANVGIYALGLQLRALGLTDETAEPSSAIVETYFDLFTAHGDAIALQYGGSEANKKMTLIAYEDSVRRGGGGVGGLTSSSDIGITVPNTSSHVFSSISTTDSSTPSISITASSIGTTAASSAAAAASNAAGSVAQATSGSMAKLKLSSSGPSQVLTSVKRYVSNAFTDSLKQASINLFLGVWRPKRHISAFGLHLWDLESDYLLHNPNLLSDAEAIAAEGVLFDKNEEIERGYIQQSLPKAHQVTDDITENLKHDISGKWWEIPLSSFEASQSTKNDDHIVNASQSFLRHIEGESVAPTFTAFETILSQPHLLPVSAASASSTMSLSTSASIVQPMANEDMHPSSSSSLSSSSTTLTSETIKKVSDKVETATTSTSETVVDLDTASTHVKDTSSLAEPILGLEKARRLFGPSLKSVLHDPKHSESLFGDVLGLKQRHHFDTSTFSLQNHDSGVVERAFGAAVNLVVARANTVNATFKKRGYLRGETSLQQFLTFSTPGERGLPEGLDVAYSAVKISSPSAGTIKEPSPFLSSISLSTGAKSPSPLLVASPPPSKKLDLGIDSLSLSTKISLASNSEYPPNQSMKVDAKFLQSINTKNNGIDISQSVVPSISPSESDSNTFSRYVALAGIVSQSENDTTTTNSSSSSSSSAVPNTGKSNALLLTSKTEIDLFSRSVIFPGIGAANAALQSGLGPGDLAIALGAADAGGATASLLQSLSESSSLSQQQKWYIMHPLALNPYFSDASNDIANQGLFAEEPIGRDASSKLLSSYSRNLWQRELLYRASVATECHLSHSSGRRGDSEAGIENLLIKGDTVVDKTEELPSTLSMILVTSI